LPAAGQKLRKQVTGLGRGFAGRHSLRPINNRVYVFSHPTKDATVIDSRKGAVLGTIDLGGVPEQGVAEDKGMLYVVMQDAEGSVTAVDVRTMKAIGHYPLGDKGGCNGLALDAKNRVLFAACARSGNPLAQPPQPTMVILGADDGKILTGGSDGAVFNGMISAACFHGENGEPPLLVACHYAQFHNNDKSDPRALSNRTGRHRSRASRGSRPLG
jgi:hypothetical protein